MLWVSALSPQSVRRRAASLTRRRSTGGRACPAQCSPQRLAGLRPTCLMLDCDMSMFTSAGLLACAGLRATCSSCDRRGSSTLAPSCTLCPPFSVCLCALGPLTDHIYKSQMFHPPVRWARHDHVGPPCAVHGHGSDASRGLVHRGPTGSKVVKPLSSRAPDPAPSAFI